MVNISVSVYVCMYACLHTGNPNIYVFGFAGGLDSKESTCNVGDRVPSLGWEDPLKKEMATHSSILAWRISWTV